MKKLKNYLKNLMPKKLQDLTKFSPKLVNVALRVLAVKPLSNTKNNTSKFLFSNEAKVGQVSAFDKQTPDKTSVLNFRPIFILYTSKKIGL